MYNCQLTELDVSNHSKLQVLDVEDNKIGALDLAHNPELLLLFTSYNSLTWLNIKNGNNSLLDTMLVYGNPDLTCIQVDNIDDALLRVCNLPNNGWCKDETASYSEDCQLGTENFTTTDFQLFPNPSENLLHIQTKENIESVKIYSIQGVLVKEVSSKTLDVSGLNAGMYFVQITSNEKTITKKFIKE